MTNISRRQLLLSGSSLFCAHKIWAQEDVTFSTVVKVVNVLATVRTKKGEIVRDLTKDDFSLAENGRPQQIRYFSRQTDLPLTIGLMVDTSMSQQRVLDAERSASFRFLDQVLRENKDHVFIMQFDMIVRMRQELTSSRNQLDEVLATVDTPSRSELRMQWGGGTLLFDAIVKAANDVMQSQTGRKALIVLSDGVDNGSEANVAAAVEAALRADTLIYSILFSDAGFYGLGGGGDGRGAMKRLASETGGSFFEVSKRQTIEQVYAGLEEELRSRSNLGYVSDVPVRISEFSKFQLTTNKPSLIVEARDKYWAKR
jgi:VWFA-related protein